MYLEGEIQYRSYEDREAVTRYVTQIRARELVMLGSNGNPDAGSATARAAGVPAGSSSAIADATELSDDDLPF